MLRTYLALNSFGRSFSGRQDNFVIYGEDFRLTEISRDSQVLLVRNLLGEQRMVNEKTSEGS